MPCIKSPCAGARKADCTKTQQCSWVVNKGCRDPGVSQPTTTKPPKPNATPDTMHDILMSIPVHQLARETKEDYIPLRISKTYICGQEDED